MAMRMLEYVVNIWKHYVDADPNTKTLPAVIPLVVHTGSDGGRWTAATEVGDLIDLARADRHEFGPYRPSFRYLVDALARNDLGTLMSRDYTPVARVMMVLQRIAPGNDRLDRDVMMSVRDLQAMVTTGVPGELGAAITYILRVSDITVDGLRPLMDRLGPRAEEEIVTTAERLEAQGQRRVLLGQLTAKFGPLPDHTIRTIGAASPSQIDTWAIRALTADTLHDVFR
ncbi:Rpn family recombination-promoting nuclease/putative transposase [Nocardia asteroides]